jgi:hypothetical protein
MGMKIIKTMNNSKNRDKIFSTMIETSKTKGSQHRDYILFECKHSNYDVSFGTSEEDDFKLNVFEFGCMIKDKWVEFSPTEAHLKMMQKKIDEIVSEVLENSIERFEIIEDYYEYNGVKPQYFF